MRAAYLQSGLNYLMGYTFTVAVILASLYMGDIEAPGNMLDMSLIFKMLAYFAAFWFCAGYATAVEARLNDAVWRGRYWKAQRLFARYVFVFCIGHFSLWLVAASLNMRDHARFEWSSVLYVTAAVTLAICALCYVVELCDNQSEPSVRSPL